MKIKPIITGILLFFVGFSVIYLVVSESRALRTKARSTTQAVFEAARDNGTIDNGPETPEEAGQQKNPIVASIPTGGQAIDVVDPVQQEQPTTKAEPAPTWNDQTSGVTEKGALPVQQVALEEQPAQRRESSGQEDPAIAEPEHTVIAYYFHGTARCRTCRTIEAYAAEAVESGFPSALKDGTLKWQVVNVDVPENRHFIQDYQLTTRSVVLVDMWDGKQEQWKNLMQVWQLVRNKQAFTSYIQAEIKIYLAGKHE